MASSSNLKVSPAPISSIKITPNYYQPYQPIFPFMRPPIPSSVTSDGMVSQETPTPKPKSRKRKFDKDKSVPVLERSPLNPERLVAETTDAMEKQCDTNITGGASSKKKLKEKAPILEADSEDESSSSEEGMNLGDFDTTGISKEEMELWSTFAPQNQQLVKTFKREKTPVQQSSPQRRPSVPTSVKRNHMTRMEKYVRDHPFFAQQSVFKFSTIQRRAFERDVYDHARGLNYSKANAKKQVVTARHLCGEKDYDSDDSRLDGFREIDDSVAVLVRKPEQISSSLMKALDEALTKKRKLEPTKNDTSEGDQPSKKNKKGKSLFQAETENQISSSTSLSLTNKHPEAIPIKDLRIRVTVSMITAMVEIIEGHIECDCKGQNSIGGDSKKLDDEHGENSMDTLLTKKHWPKFRKGLLRPFDFQRLRDDTYLHKALMDLIQDKNSIKSKLMKAWRVAQSHGARSHGARNKYERSFYDTIEDSDDLDDLLRLAPAPIVVLKDKVDAVYAEQYMGVAEVPRDLPAKKPKKKKEKKGKKVGVSEDVHSNKDLVDPSIEPPKSTGVDEAQQASMGEENPKSNDPSIKPWKSTGVDITQQASLDDGNTKSNESAPAEPPPSGTVENKAALTQAEKAEKKARKAERKARRKERRERDRQNLKEADTNAGDPKIEIISHKKEDEFSDLAGIIDGLYSASLKQEEPQDITEKPSEPITHDEHPSNDQSASAADQGNIQPKPREIIEISSNSPSPPLEQPKKWTKDQKHKALQADSWLMYTGESADGFSDRLEATFQDLERKKGFRFTHEEQLRIQDMLQANYGDWYEGNDLQDRVLDRIATIQSRDEMIPPGPKKAKGKEKEKSRAKSISRKSGFQSPMIR